MPVRINGATSGYVELAAPAVAGSVVMTLPATTGTVATTADTAAAGGMVLITPTSVAGTGVTVSGGLVSFTTATAVSVNGCFTSTYENYVVVGTLTAASAILGMRGRMRAAGTDNSSANYDGSTDIMAAATGTITQSDGGAGASYFTGPGMASGSEGAGFKIEFFAPALTQRTGVIIHATRSAGLYFGSTYLTVTTAYDGFTWYASSNNISGSLRVYGLRNS